MIKAPHRDRKRRPKSLLAGLFFFLPGLISLAGCESAPRHQSLEEILRSGELTVITRNNSHCYYLYRDQPMGFEYDLAKRFADTLGVRLKVRIAGQWEAMIPELMNGDGDFIAASMTITDDRQKQVAFSDGYLEVQQHIIVHRSNFRVSRAEDLAGMEVHVRRGTSYEVRLRQLQKEGIDLTIVTHPDVPTEELIRQVSEGKIDVTIADTNIAFRNRRYYPQAIVAGTISEKETLGWAVHPEAKNLLDRINLFFRTISADGTFQELYERYYTDVDFFDYVDLRTFHRRIKTRLPRYQEIIQEAADASGFDWRLIAAQIYQESHFNPAARSTSEAQGLMQLTATVAESHGVDSVLDPGQNIRAGVRHLQELFSHFDKALGDDRMWISLAAYNIGLGHLWDARNLARTLGLDPNRWSSLAKTLPLLSYAKYYKGTKYGYARGKQAVMYVKHIQIYYDILKYQSLAIGTGEKSKAGES